MRRGRSRRSLGGFTMIELLSVMAILMMLASILLPALLRAREKARGVQCMGQLRGIGGGFSLYANDWGDHFPCYSEGAYQPMYWVFGQPNVSWNLGPRIWHEVIDTYITRGNKELHCPVSGFRYGINLEIQHRGVPPECRAGALPVQHIDFPFNKFLAGDSRPLAVPDVYREHGWQPVCIYSCGPTGSLTVGATTGYDPNCIVGLPGDSHDGRPSMLYADGHADCNSRYESLYTTTALEQHWIPSQAYEAKYRQYWACWW